MLACRPVEWPTTGPLADQPPSIIYPGVIVTNCDACGVEVYLGPKQQGFKEREPDLPVVCFGCVPKFAERTQVVHLGNQYLPGSNPRREP